ncbi:hypothetical protein BDN72DRAFT_843245 [Pluteus cervinus]|uniref:Uncharacterized protein n=1 Tax=Pluteus cervinus TaxID=181527 RepID=A0ACD3AQW9_9AGAR|nr:hypothetical protein BDN72DRAFT_843245 [Pluteus cervinus]
MSSKPSRKRKYGSHHQKERDEDLQEPSKTDYSLYIQAYEADIARGPQAQALAESLEANPLSFEDEEGSTGVDTRKFGSALLRWEPGGSELDGLEENDEGKVVLVDRYVLCPSGSTFFVARLPNGFIHSFIHRWYLSALFVPYSDVLKIGTTLVCYLMHSLL